MGAFQAQGTVRRSPAARGNVGPRMCRKACVAETQRARGVYSQQGWRGSQGLEAQHWGGSEMMAPLEDTLTYRNTLLSGRSVLLINDRNIV